METIPGLPTVEQACQELNCSESTLFRRLREADVKPAVQSGRLAALACETLGLRQVRESGLTVAQEPVDSAATVPRGDRLDELTRELLAHIDQLETRLNFLTGQHEVQIDINQELGRLYFAQQDRIDQQAAQIAALASKTRKRNLLEAVAELFSRWQRRSVRQGEVYFAGTLATRRAGQ